MFKNQHYHVDKIVIYNIDICDEQPEQHLKKKQKQKTQYDHRVTRAGYPTTIYEY